MDQRGKPSYVLKLINRRPRATFAALVTCMMLVGMVINASMVRRTRHEGTHNLYSVKQQNPKVRVVHTERRWTMDKNASTNVTSSKYRPKLESIIKDASVRNAFTDTSNQVGAKTISKTVSNINELPQNLNQSVNRTLLQLGGKIENVKLTKGKLDIGLPKYAFIQYRSTNRGMNSKGKVHPEHSNSGTCTADFKSRHLMTSTLAGRLGNQLFELSTLLAAANDSCFTAVIPSYNKILDSVFVFDDIVRMNVNTSRFGRFPELAWGFYNGPIAENIHSGLNWTIPGFRQSFRYFQHKKDLVRASFVFRDDIRKDVWEFFANRSIQFKTKVGIHVRRGDFLNAKNLEYGYTPSSKAYIIKAMSYINKRYNTNQNLVHVVVSDDIEWCKDNLNFTNAVFSPFHDEGRDLFMLTQCDHNIITTGTFGWMGAWLNETGTVVYDKAFPKRHSRLWHGHLKEHYYPDWWVGL